MHLSTFSKTQGTYPPHTKLVKSDLHFSWDLGARVSFESNTTGRQSTASSWKLHQGGKHSFRYVYFSICAALISGKHSRNMPNTIPGLHTSRFLSILLKSIFVFVNADILRNSSFWNFFIQSKHSSWLCKEQHMKKAGLLQLHWSTGVAEISHMKRSLPCYGKGQRYPGCINLFLRQPATSAPQPGLRVEISL